MSILEIMLIAVGLSMDAFAVAVCKGLSMRRLNVRYALVIAAFFGGFQALMPLLGWAIGYQFASSISGFSHMIAFALLAGIGAKMVHDALRESEVESVSADTAEAERIDLRETALLAIATSIDALAVGVTFASLELEITAPALLIGATTFSLSLAGVAIGNRFGAHCRKAATVAGGVVLIILGVKFLLEQFVALPF